MINLFKKKDIKKNIVITDKKEFIKEKDNILKDKFGNDYTVYKINDIKTLDDVRPLSGQINTLSEDIDSITLDTKNLLIISKVIDSQYNFINKKMNYNIFFIHREKNKLQLI
jgi:hypothetical protein